jgi:hypothetical protein
MVYALHKLLYFQFQWYFSYSHQTDSLYRLNVTSVLFSVLPKQKKDLYLLYGIF